MINLVQSTNVTDELTWVVLFSRLISQEVFTLGFTITLIGFIQLGHVCHSNQKLRGGGG